MGDVQKSIKQENEHPVRVMFSSSSSSSSSSSGGSGSSSSSSTSSGSSNSNNSNKLLYLHDRIILQYCKSMYMKIKIYNKTALITI